MTNATDYTALALPGWRGRIGRYYVQIWLRPRGSRWDLCVELLGFDTHHWTFSRPEFLAEASTDSTMSQVIRGVAWSAGGGQVRLNPDEADEVLARIDALGRELQLILGDNNG